MYLPVPGFEPTSSEYLDKCATCILHSTKTHEMDHTTTFHNPKYMSPFICSSCCMEMCDLAVSGIFYECGLRQTAMAYRWVHFLVFLQ